MNEVYLSLGSNEGDRVNWLQRALSLISANCGNIIKASAIYETAAWGNTSQPDFLNMVVHIRTVFSPHDLIRAVLDTEITLGRQRTIKWGQRTIDIDILFYNNIILQRPDLIIPHPLLQERRFILTPLAEIEPDLVHPQLHKTIRELLAECNDPLTVNTFKEARR